MHNRAVVVLLAVVLGGTLGQTPAQSVAPAAARIDERLTKLLSTQPKNVRIGVLVVDADSGVTWFAYQPDKLLKPASVQKLFITAAALDRWGPKFEYETRVYLQRDELWVCGAGDPALGDQRIAERYGQQADYVFRAWAAGLKERGISALSRIVLDDCVFDEQWTNTGWPEEQADRWYQAPVGGLNLNDNCLDVTVELQNRQIGLRLQPELPADCIRNDLAIGKRRDVKARRGAGGAVFELRGTVNRTTELDSIPARDPSAFFGRALEQALAKQGITVAHGAVRRRLSDMDLASATLFARHSTALPDVLWRANTFSQNLFAECLMKSLATYGPDGRRSGAPGSWDGGRTVVRDTLARLGIDLTGATLRDGSGLSHENRASAAQITHLLAAMRKHRFSDAFVNSLARAGELGSMHNRYADPLLRGRLCGKTGTLVDTHALAGYLTRPDGQALAFAIVINGQYDALPLKICRILLDAEPGR